MIRTSGDKNNSTQSLRMCMIKPMMESSSWLWLWVWLSVLLHGVLKGMAMADEPLLSRTPAPAPAPAPSISLPFRHTHQHREHHHAAIARAPSLYASPPSGSSATRTNPFPVVSTPSAPSSSSSSTSNSSDGPPLDPAQLSALRSLGIHVGSDPCSAPSMHDTLLCDRAAPARHVIALHLQLCARDSLLTTEALANLETLEALSFLDCPMLPAPVPPKLLNTLSSLTCIASLGPTSDAPSAPPLPSTWLSKFHNLSQLAVADVHVNASGLSFIISKMRHLKQLKFSNTNISGILPVNTWPHNITSLDLASNSITGNIPKTISRLAILQELDLSANQLTGRIPNVFTKMKRLQKLVLASNALSGPIPTSLTDLSSLIYLDVSNNKLTGSLLEAFNNMRSLRYLDLSHNHLTGPLPFNQTFLDKLNTLKLRGNFGICYDHSSLKSTFLVGISACDSSGMPIVPSTESPAQPPEEAFAPSGQVTEGSPTHHHRGPRTIVAAVAITLVVIVVFIVVVVLVSRCRDRKY